MIYISILASPAPALINVLINIPIFIFVRTSANRIHVSESSTATSSVTVQSQKISRREIALIKHMAYMFWVFVIGWSPVYITSIVGLFTIVDSLVYHLTVILCEASVLTIVLTLFKINRDLRQYLWDKIRFCRAP